MRSTCLPVRWTLLRPTHGVLQHSRWVPSRSMFPVHGVRPDWRGWCNSCKHPSGLCKQPQIHLLYTQEGMEAVAAALAALCGGAPLVPLSGGTEGDRQDEAACVALVCHGACALTAVRIKASWLQTCRTPAMSCVRGALRVPESRSVACCRCPSVSLSPERASWRSSPAGLRRTCLPSTSP